MDMSDNARMAGGLRGSLRLDEPIEAPKERRLARSALADERDRAACGNFDAYVVECDDIAKTMCDIVRGE